jgi:hypothetical protein
LGKTGLERPERDSNPWPAAWIFFPEVCAFLGV